MDKDEILKKVEARETNNTFFNRCIDARVCPECGGDLKNQPFKSATHIKIKCENCKGFYLTEK